MSGYQESPGMGSEIGSRLAERVESVKAGLVSAGAAGGTFAIAELGLHQWASPALAAQWAVLPTHLMDGWGAAAIVLLSGFLFGATYRYAVRRDTNSHLKSGAVMAFGLVRGLAQMDVGLRSQLPIWALGWMGLESVMLFAVAALALEWAFRQGWVATFPST